MSIKAIIFDCDGTIVDSSFLHAIASSRALKSVLGINASPEILLELTAGMDSRKAFELITDAAIHGRHGITHDELYRYKMHFADTVFADFIEAADKEYLDILEQHPKEELLIDGFQDFFDYVLYANSGVPVGRDIINIITSNGSEQNVHSSVKRTGYYDHFELIICRNHVEHGKPHPEMVLRAIAHAKSHGIRPHEILYIGDTMPDVLAASAAGIKVCTVLAGNYMPNEKKFAMRVEMEDAGALVYDCYRGVLEMFRKRPEPRSLQSLKVVPEA